MGRFRRSPHIALGVLLLLMRAGITPAFPQSAFESRLGDSRPQVGSVGGLRLPSQLPLISGSRDAAAQIHRNAIGRPCLTVYGRAKPQATNKTIYDHSISVSNTCVQPIKLKVCYYHSEDCVKIVVPGFGRKEAVLGIMPQMKEFRFEYWEQFGRGPSGFLGAR
jgi:hypothetical protein